MCITQQEIWNDVAFNMPQYLDIHGVLALSYTSDHLTVIRAIYLAIWPCHYRYVLHPAVSWSTVTAEAIVYKDPRLGFSYDRLRYIIFEEGNH